MVGLFDLDHALAAILKFKMATMENLLGVQYSVFLRESQFSKTNFVNFKVINPTCLMKMSLAAFFKFKLDSEQTPFLTMLYDFVQQKATYFLKSLVILVC